MVIIGLKIMKQLDIFIRDLKQQLRRKLLCVTIFGSKANYGLTKIKSNVDLLIIVESLLVEDLIKISPIIKKWMKAGNPYPIVMTREEFFSSNDVCAIEYSDIQWNYQVVYGENLIKELNVCYSDLKIQCVKELKTLITKFRSYYTMYYNKPKVMRKAFVKIVSNCLVIFRVILRLQNITPSVYKNDVIDQASKIITFDIRLFKNCLGQKERSFEIPKYVINDYAALVINDLSKILKQVDAM